MKIGRQVLTIMMCMVRIIFRSSDELHVRRSREQGCVITKEVLYGENVDLDIVIFLFCTTAACLRSICKRALTINSPYYAIAGIIRH